MPNETKRALITGITGQDGSYLAELLLSKGYAVHGLVRRTSTANTSRIGHLLERIGLHHGDLTDATGVRQVLERVQPHEVYNLAAQSHVRVSFEQAEYTADVVATGALRLFEAVRDSVEKTGIRTRVYQAGSSEMFGSAAPPQNEQTPFHPRSPYAVAKLAAHWYGVNAREAYGLFVANGIMFNHESERRGETFVTRKITRAVGRIKKGLQEKLQLGNIYARRDWGFAGDYVEAMWLMLQQEKADDYVIATGESHSVEQFLEIAFSQANLDWRDYVEFDAKQQRPAEVDYLLGDASKAQFRLGWAPRVSFQQLVRRMVQSDLELAERERVSPVRALLESTAA
ncbi:MAG: GDP-mannose 4,6-dehydratase [Bryobacteraceae bacterium]|nr:GDP-mannose 4,6-dehydratase [Bryobacteraceae bacterium]